MTQEATYTFPDGRQATITGTRDQIVRQIAEFEAEAGGTSLEKAGTAAARGSARGLIVGAPTAAGAIMGGKLGAAAGTAVFPGPGTLIGGGIGALIGAVAGAMTGEAAAEQIAETTGIGGKNVEGPQYQPYYRAGESFGAAVPFMAAPFAFKPTKTGTGVLDPVLRSAQSAPRTFMAGETAAAAGAAAGAGVASGLSDDDPTARMVGEIVGGTLSPIAMVTRVSDGLLSNVKTFARSQTKAGREREAAQVAQDFVRSRGGEPEDVARRLEEEGAIAGAQPTAAQKTASPGLMALEKGLLRGEREAGAEVTKQMEATLQAQAEAFLQLPDTGNPDELRAFAEARQRHWHQRMQARIAQANREAQRIAAEIDPNDPLAREAANRQARELIDDARQDARTTEDALWNRVPAEEIFSADPGDSATAREVNEARADLGDGEKLSLPEWLNNTLDNIEGGGEFELGELQRARSRLLREARRLSQGADADPDMARRFRNIADGLANDMAEVSAEAAAARDFTFQRVRNFGRGEVGNILRRNVLGDQTPEALTIEQGMAAGGLRGAEAVDDLRQAMEPIEAADITPSEAAMLRPEQMANAQETVLRDMAQKVIDPDTRTVNPNSLARWQRNNASLLERFPVLRDQLADAETAQRTLNRQLNIYERGQKAAAERSAFNRLARIEDPNAAVADAMRGDAPLRDLNALANTARKDKTGAAMKGLRQATVETVLDEVTDNRGLISGSGLKEFLDSPLAKSMKKSGTLTQGMQERMARLADELETFELAVRRGEDTDKVLAEPDNMFDLLVRALGANIGGSSGLAQVSGAQLVMAGYGSRMARRIMERVPQGKVKNVLIDAVRDPKLMADLMRKPTSPRHALAIERRINAYLLQAGLVPKED